MKTYSEKLKDPRWQKKRLEVFEFYKFTCSECSSLEKTLHAHHRSYKKNTEPWEYELSELDCLCHECHSKREDLLEKARIYLGNFSNEKLHIFNNDIVPMSNLCPESFKLTFEAFRCFFHEAKETVKK